MLFKGKFFILFVGCGVQLKGLPLMHATSELTEWTAPTLVDIPDLSNGSALLGKPITLRTGESASTHTLYETKEND